ncbi:hypothetical protein C7N43_06925 [Sphingobacteriales bacterium UPWRP_1]|nr:hypothetical protein BVG80_13375 [Sphingobacteriales bacterium TSM_CSM]PSJ77815.1 hypothetical protein C7N43_06925 [Sphingobacteriales bacterium UPWRP_1]
MYFFTYIATLLNLNCPMLEFLKDFWLFLMERKKWWLAPIIIVLLLLGILLIFSGGSAVTPFIYTLF